MERKRKQAGSESMKRFICYLYEYQEGRRIRNIGFCKVEAGKEECAVSIHGKMGCQQPEKTFPLPFLARKTRNALEYTRGSWGMSARH